MSSSTINAETWDDAFGHDPREARDAGQVTWQPALTLLFHPHYARIGDRVALPELLYGETVAVGRLEPEFTAPTETWGDPLRDAGISRKPFVLEGMPGGGVCLQQADCPTRIEVDGHPLTGSLVLSRARIKAGVVLQLAERMVLLLHLIPPTGEALTEGTELIGESAGIRRVRAEIKRIADLDVTVFLRGETGTGKELAARALHQAGPRAARRMVGVNLGALPSGVAGAALFGATRGAYTGAVRDQEGYFRAAHRGTLFLDEIGEAGADVQAMLLRVLETGEFCPVGSTQPIKVDTRIVAATDADLEDRVGAGAFKAPLLHRLSGYEIWLPPLRERIDDLGRLLVHFARGELAEIGEVDRLDVAGYREVPWIPARLVARLARYSWPGNVRQFRNVVRQLVIGSRGLAHMTPPPAVERLLRQMEGRGAVGTGTDHIPVIRKAKKHRKPSSVTETELLETLERHAWNLKAGAEELGVSRASLYTLIKKHDGLRTTADLGSAEIRAAWVQHGGDVEGMADALKVSRHALNRRVFELGLTGTPET